MSFILFEPPQREHFLPIAFTRPVYEIRTGIFTIKEKWEQLFSQEVKSFLPEFLQVNKAELFTGYNTFINGAINPDSEFRDAVAGLIPNQLLVHREEVLACCSESEKFIGYRNVNEDWDIVEYKNEPDRLLRTWDIISGLGRRINGDFELLQLKYSGNVFPDWATIIGSEKIFVGKNVSIGACILNSSKGKILIDDYAEIGDGAIINGPVYIGKQSKVNIGAKISGPVSIGPYCKIGGEVCHSVFQGYSNKGHDGFLGHSFIGEWCNLGADTNVSNLKNSYEFVRMWNYASNCFEKTGMQFLGLVMGDHSKTGINTMLNTGTVTGVACNIYGAGFPRVFIPSFTQGGAQHFKEFSLTQAYKMADAMMKRRNMILKEEDKIVLERIYHFSSANRKK
ncbi:MAG: glucose-1-phosphate thymidylyltransferase [Prolixibacteraceae bacterium]|nr:glucose-1-phosphate thymidylyltransferase [Prolixibacteraceae bacterium]